MRTTIDHNRLYGAFLALSAALTAFQAAGLLYWHQSFAEPLGHLAVWAVPWVGALNALYCGAILATLSVRRYRPELGARLTRILNWALLPAVVGGTVLGLYGLLKVDRTGHR